MTIDTRAGHVIAELKADVADLSDRLYPVEERIVRLDAEVAKLRSVIREMERTAPPPLSDAPVLGGQSLDMPSDNGGTVPPEPAQDFVEGVGGIEDGPWTPYLDSIRALASVRQRQVILLPGLWNPYGLTAPEIVHDVAEFHPERPMRMTNVYPLIKAMLSKGLLLETPDTYPARYTVRRAKNG